jgi:hypothetical protein
MNNATKDVPSQSEKHVENFLYIMVTIFRKHIFILKRTFFMVIRLGKTKFVSNHRTNGNGGFTFALSSQISSRLMKISWRQRKSREKSIENCVKTKKVKI